LFAILTEENDTLTRWTCYTFPVRYSFIASAGTDPKEIKVSSASQVTTKTDGVDEEEDVQVNCTAAFMADCMPFNKCKSSCTSMGASAYRWFHDGCCECVGPNCINYGINDSRCGSCPLKEEDEEAEMVIDGATSSSSSSVSPSSSDDKTEDYEVGPAPEEDEVHRQDNNVVKKEDPEEKEKHSKDLGNSVSKKPF